MRVSAILLAGAAVAVAQDVPTIPSDFSLPADVNSLLSVASTAIPNFSQELASISAFAASIYTNGPIPTNDAELSSYIASVSSVAATAFGAPLATNTGSPAAGNTGAAGANGSPVSSSTGGAAAPMQTGLGMMIAGGVAAGIAAVAL